MTIFPGCKCCGPCWRCYSKELDCSNVLPYWQNVADIAGKHQEAFRLLDANINSDARPPDIFQPGFGVLAWQDGSVNRASYVVLGGATNPRIEFQIVDDKDNVFFLSAVSCLGDITNKYYLLSMYALNEASPKDSSSIKHISTSGVETVLYTGGPETQIELPVNEDSQFFLGQYVAEHFDGSRAIIELKSLYQLLNNLSQPVDHKCFDAPPAESGWLPVGDCHPTEEECAKECRKCTDCSEFWDFAYFDVVQTKNYKDSFRIEYGSLDTDSSPDLSFNGQELRWEGDNSDPTQQWGRIIFAANSISDQLRRFVSVYAGRFFNNTVYGISVSQECDVASGASILEVSTNVADEIRHIAEDGTETVWTKTSSEGSRWNRSVLIQEGEESPYRTGVYLMEEQPGFQGGSFPIQAVSISLLPGSRQIFPTIDFECPPPRGRTMPQTKTGPGTELANLFKWFNIHAKEKGCGCKSMQKKMDKGGPQWCRDNKEEILAHLEKEAKKRKLPFVKLAASKLVDLAIRRSERG